MKFLDQVKIYTKAGNGGNGSCSFRREKFIEFGGPDGGNGGRGGSIIVQAVNDLNTLIDYRYQQHFRAPNGKSGSGRQRTGADGAPLILKVPVGTEILDEDKNHVLMDMVTPHQEFILAKGGDGGFGNAHFKSSTNQAPRKTIPGWEGPELWVWLRLKLIADAGIVGLPNAGKSTFLSAVTRAKPKIADYPFTTLAPQLGVVGIDDHEFVLADLPGLIEGAHLGAGLGDRFLGHLERCRVVLHLIDATSPNILQDYQIIRHELNAYGAGLDRKPELIGLNKWDALTPEEQEEKKEILTSACGDTTILPCSGVTQYNVIPILRLLWQRIQEARPTISLSPPLSLSSSPFHPLG